MPRSCLEVSLNRKKTKVGTYCLSDIDLLIGTAVSVLNKISFWVSEYIWIIIIFKLTKIITIQNKTLILGFMFMWIFGVKSRSDFMHDKRWYFLYYTACSKLFGMKLKENWNCFRSQQTDLGSSFFFLLQQTKLSIWYGSSSWIIDHKLDHDSHGAGGLHDYFL